MGYRNAAFRSNGFAALLLPQLAAQDLAYGRFGQVSAEDDPRGLFVSGEVSFAVVRTSRSVRFGSFLTMNTLTASPDFSSGTPITAHSSTPGRWRPRLPLRSGRR